MHRPTHPRTQHESYAEPRAVAPESACLNCGAPLAGTYCAACGQKAVDLAAPTWHVVREAISDAMDFDGRVLRTVRALGSPGRLTVEFLRGRRAPYLGPLKLFLAAGAALSTTWVLTRGVDGRYYGIVYGASAVGYIDTIVRGLLAASVAIAISSWAIAGRRRRLLDEVVLALYLVAALSFLAAAVVWLATAWKFAWTTQARVPRGVPALQYLLFFPAAAVGLIYIIGTLRQVHRGPWWATALRTIVLTAVGLGAVALMLYAPYLMSR